jgi:hypothetical protein
MIIELRHKILKDSDNWLSAFMITKKYGITMQTVNCVLLFRHLDDSTFVCVNDWDIHTLTVIDIASKTEYDHATIKRLLRTYTASEIVQDREIIKVNKEKRGSCQWGASIV